MGSITEENEELKYTVGNGDLSKGGTNMISRIIYWLRYFLAVCFIAAIAFMIACTVFVIALIANENIRIRMVKDGHEEKKRNRKRRW